MEPDNELDLGSQLSHEERVARVLKYLRDRHLSILNFLLHILESSKQELAMYRDRFISNPSGKLIKVLDHVLDDKRGQAVLSSWFEERALQLVLGKVEKEMDDIKTALTRTINNTTLDTLLSWDVDAFIGPLVETKVPMLGSILRTAAQTK